MFNEKDIKSWVTKDLTDTMERYWIATHEAYDDCSDDHGDYLKKELWVLEREYYRRKKIDISKGGYLSFTRKGESNVT